MHINWNRYSILALMLVFAESTTQSFSLKKSVNNLFTPQQEELVHKEYTLEKNGTVTIENLSGSITVQAWKTNKVMVKAVKKGTAQDLTTLAVTEKTITPTNISLSSEQTKDGAGGTIEYQLIVPHTASLELSQHNGAITIQQVGGHINATTKNGAIDVQHTNNTVKVSSSKGSINIVEPNGNVQATTVYGSINIVDAKKSVIANSESGSITARCKEVPATARVALTTQSGAITLHVPSETNADVQAKTKHGRIISNHLITLKPVTTKLDQHAWTQFKKEVHGTIGSGEASIVLNATNSSIKIMEYTC